jgi:GNAT superfamily N-acetyltransferase
MIQIRNATLSDVPGVAKVHVDVWKTTYAGIVPKAFLEGRTYENKAPMWKRIIGESKPREHVVVAVDDLGQVVGFSCGGPNRDRNFPYGGEIFAIYLLQGFQGQGIGRRLFEASVDCLIRDQFSNMLVWVLQENPSCKFYSRMGGIVVGEKLENIGGKDLKELAFAWAALNLR